MHSFPQFFLQCQCNLDLNNQPDQPTLEKSEDEQQSFEIEPSTMDSCILTKFHHDGKHNKSFSYSDYDCKEYMEEKYFSSKEKPIMNNNNNPSDSGVIPISRPTLSLAPIMSPPQQINMMPPDVPNQPIMPHQPVMPHPLIVSEPILPHILESLAIWAESILVIFSYKSFSRNFS